MPEALTYDERVIAGAVLDQFAGLLRRHATQLKQSNSKSKGPGHELYWEGVIEGLEEAAQMATGLVAG